MFLLRLLWKRLNANFILSPLKLVICIEERSLEQVFIFSLSLFFFEWKRYPKVGAKRIWGIYPPPDYLNTLKIFNFFIQFLKVTFHLQLLQNIGYIPHMVQYIFQDIFPLSSLHWCP